MEDGGIARQQVLSSAYKGRRRHGEGGMRAVRPESWRKEGEEDEESSEGAGKSVWCST
jgi:hypothetical protein